MPNAYEFETIEAFAMRINISCPKCAQAAGGFAVFHVATIREDGLYTGRCPKGHDLLVATQTLRHEMLFEIAMNAIVDGYRREAISSFAASVERFYEFSLRVLSKNRKVPEQIFDAAWKTVSSQSERQLGAFVFLYVVTFGQHPRILNNRMVQLRNDVIHRGVLPDKDQVLEFGAAAYELIQMGVQKLRAECIDDVNVVLKEHVAEIAEKMGNEYPRSFQVTPTALNVIKDISSGYTPFNQLLAERGISIETS
jgi:hypothetical protein